MKLNKLRFFIALFTAIALPAVETRSASAAPPDETALKAISEVQTLLRQSDALNADDSGGALWIATADSLNGAGDKAAALQTLRQTVPLAVGATNIWARISTLQQLAKAQAALGDRQGAADTFAAAIKAAQRGGPPSRWLSMRDTAQAQLDAGDKAAALQTCALEVQRIAAGSVTNNIDDAELLASGFLPGFMPAVELRDIAVIQAKAGDSKGALASARSIHPQAPSDREYQEQAYGLLAQALAEVGDSAGAAEAMRYLAQVQGPGYPLAFGYAQIARALAKREDVKSALDQAAVVAGIDWSKSGAPGSSVLLTTATATNVVLQMACQGLIERGDFAAARATAAHLPEPGSGSASTGAAPFPSATKSQVLAQIALALAERGQVAEAQSILDAMRDKSPPLLAAVQTEIEERNGEWEAASNRVQALPDPFYRGVEFVRLATMETSKGRTNEALATLARAMEGASATPPSANPWTQNSLERRTTLLCRIARQQQAAGDPAAAARTLELATKTASDQFGRPGPLNNALSAGNALRLVAQAEGDLGLWQDAWNTLRRADAAVHGAAPSLARSSTRGPTSSLQLLARAAAKSGQEALARQWAGEETEPLARARILLGISEGLLDQRR